MHLLQNDCIANVEIYSIPTFWQNEGIACKKYSSIPTFLQNSTIETQQPHSATYSHSSRRSVIYAL